MKYFSNIEIPESQRPFYPYVAEQNDGTRLVLRKNASPRVAVSLSLLLLNVTGAIAFASWTYFAVAIFFFGMFIVDLLEGSECQLTVESTAVTIRRKFLALEWTSIINVTQIQAIEAVRKRRSASAYAGFVRLRMDTGKKTLLEFVRKGDENTDLDLDKVSTIIGSILRIPVERRPAL